MKNIDDIVKMIDQSMGSGVSRLLVGFSDEIEEGEEQELHHFGRCDVGSPWAKGTVSNCDKIDIPAEEDDPS